MMNRIYSFEEFEDKPNNEKPWEPEKNKEKYANELISGYDRIQCVPEQNEKEQSGWKREELNPEPDIERKSVEFVSEHTKQEDQYSDPDKIDFFIVTKIPKDAKHFLWTINQFSSLPDIKELLTPGIYRLGSAWCRLKLVKKETGFSLYFVKSGQRTRPVTGFQTTFSATLPVTETEGVSHETVFSNKLEFNISATDYKSKMLANYLVTFSDSQESICKTIGEYIAIEQITLPKDILILDCHVAITMAPVSEKQCFKPSDKLVRQSWIKLSEDLKSMYQNSLNADVTLIVGTDEIRANKSILSARSPVFKKMFQHDIKENEKNSIKITDVPIKSLKILIEFLYSGNLEVNEENFSMQDLRDLYFTANEYEVADLKSICAKLLLFKVTVDNVSEILTWADQCNHKQLKLTLLNFIKTNFEAIADTEAWSSFVTNQTKLVAEILKTCFKTPEKSGLFY